MTPERTEEVMPIGFDFIPAEHQSKPAFSGFFAFKPIRTAYNIGFNKIAHNGRCT